MRVITPVYITLILPLSGPRRQVLNQNNVLSDLTFRLNLGPAPTGLKG